jgi:thioredoxin-dependent peroxiredoxin
VRKSRQRPAWVVLCPTRTGRFEENRLRSPTQPQWKSAPSLTSNPMIQAGENAPEFTLPDQDGNDVSLSDYSGQTVVLYFYPKADTPGCTTQACGIRDRSDEYEAAGATVIGVSPDPVDRVKKFHGGQSLNFTLLADADHAVCDAYGTWVEKSRYGKTYWGAQRSTFIIDGDGTVVHVIEKASPKTHDDEVLGVLAAA